MPAFGIAPRKALVWALCTLVGMLATEATAHGAKVDVPATLLGLGESTFWNGGTVDTRRSRLLVWGGGHRRAYDRLVNGAGFSFLPARKPGVKSR